MRLNLRIRRIFLLILVAVLLAPNVYASEGILLLAHGGKDDWNARVRELAAQVDKTRPIEVAFGMATRANIQTAIDKLIARGATEIVAVPLFVSSWSTVIYATEYLLGLRPEAPPALAAFAKMSHGATPAGASASHGGHEGHRAAADGTTPVKSTVPIRMTPALNDHEIAAHVLLSRARGISRNPSQEALVLVAHGPNEEEDNRRWLADLRSLAARIGSSEKFASIESLTVRDDAPKPVRDAATAQLRAIVERGVAAGHRVLVVPVLISFGGIERGLRQRLEGLSYTMPDAGLMPDDRLAAWVLAMADRK